MIDRQPPTTDCRGSDEIRRSKPTPQMEAKGGMAIVETVLWDAVPSYLRKLNAQCVDSLGPAYQLPLDMTPIQFSSWMGGDRDGNPNVTPKVTYEVSLTQRLQAANLILKDISNLYDELAICKGFSTEMLDLANHVKQSPDRLEKYRRVLGFLQRRLQATIRWCETELTHAANPATLSHDLATVKVRHCCCPTAVPLLLSHCCGSTAAVPLLPHCYPIASSITPAPSVFFSSPSRLSLVPRQPPSPPRSPLSFFSPSTFPSSIFYPRSPSFYDHPPLHIRPLPARPYTPPPHHPPSLTHAHT